MDPTRTHPPDPALSRERRFRALYAANFDGVLAFALRRVDTPEDAADVVAETFLVAWRRLADVPADGQERPWLFGVARRALANSRRGVERRGRLGARLRAELPAALPDHAAACAAQETVRAALDTLRPLDREVLELTLWEELTPAQVAAVLDLPARTVRTRLSRARARLRDELGDAWPHAGHVDVTPPVRGVDR